MENLINIRITPIPKQLRINNSISKKRLASDEQQRAQIAP